MAKFLLWAVIILFVMMVVRLLNKSKQKPAAREDKPEGNPRKSSSKKANQKTPEAMVRCVSCGVFVPRSEALMKPDGYHCADPDCGHHS